MMQTGNLRIKGARDETQLDLTNRNEVYEVLPNQKRRFLRYKLGVSSPANSIFCHDMNQLDYIVLNKALQALIIRHEALRTIFFYKDGQVFQKVCDTNQIETLLSVKDLSYEKDVERKANAAIEKIQNHSFDFENEQSFKCLVVKYSSNKYKFVFVIDHMIRDGESINIIKEELSTLYKTFSLGVKNPLPALKYQFRDYVEFHNDHYKGVKLKYHQDYFRQLFKDVPPRLQIDSAFKNGDNNVVKIQSKDCQSLNTGSQSELDSAHYKELILSGMAKKNRGSGYAFFISDDVMNRIQRICSKFNYTHYNYVLASYCIFLKKISNQNEFVIDSPISSRDNKIFFGIVGWLTSALVLRLKVYDDINYKNLIEEIRNKIFTAIDHRYYQDYVEDLNIKWDQMVASQFNLIYNLENEFDHSNFKPYHFDIDYAFFDFAFHMNIYSNGILVNCLYGLDLISRCEISNVCNEFIQVLDASTKSLDFK